MARRRPPARRRRRYCPPLLSAATPTAATPTAATPTAATPTAAPRLLPWLWALVLFAALWGLALARAYTLLGSYDLGYFDQAAWLLSHGHVPFVTLRGIHLLGDHGSVAFYPMGWLAGAAPWSTTTALLGLQALFLAAGVVPLWWIARRLCGLSVGVACALLGAYSLYPALSNVGLFDFHPEALVVPALLGAAYFGLRGDRWVPYGLCVAAVLACREDAAVPVLFLGLLLVLEGRRRAGALTALAATAWLILDLRLILPHFAGGHYVQGNRFGPYGATLGAAAKYMLTHPLTVAGDFATKPNLYVLVGLLAPVLFLPLISPKHLLPGLPLQLTYLLTNVAAAHTITAQYTATTIPFIFLATAFALKRLKARPLHRLMVAASVAGFLVFATASPRHEPWRWLHRDRVDRARLAAARLVPSYAAVSATTRMWPLLADRKDIYNFPDPMERYRPQSNDPVPLGGRIQALRWVVLDTADRQQWTGVESGGRDRLLGSRNPMGWRVVFDRAGIEVYTRP